MRSLRFTELYKKELHDPDNHDGVIHTVKGFSIVNEAQVDVF